MTKTLFMISLDIELKQKKENLAEFASVTKQVLKYLDLVITDNQFKGDYKISTSKMAGNEKFLRPINQNLFISNSDDFQKKFEILINTLLKIKTKNPLISIDEKSNIDSVLYTIQQSIGAGFDLLVGSNSSRKHVGNRFEELVKCVFTEIGIANKRTVLQIPYETDEGTKIYKCENDLIISPYLKVRSTNRTLDPDEIVISAKTTSKDRMGKIFIDKILLEKFVGHPQKVMGIFLNDVQRKENNSISFTLVSGLFMVYNKFLTPLEGIYYLDPPPNALKPPFNSYMKRFSDLITNDLFKILPS